MRSMSVWRTTAWRSGAHLAGRSAVSGVVGLALLAGMGAVLSAGSCGRDSEVRPAPETGWRQAPPLPVARLGVGAAALDGRLWVVGGLTADRQTSSRVDVYDPDSGTWSAGPELPVPVHHAAVVAAAGRVWSIGGHRGVPFHPVAYVFALDPAEGQWRAAEPLPSARGALAAAVVDDVIYVMGGQTEDETAVATVERYDPRNGFWEPLPPLPTPREHLSAVGLGGTVYAIGGRVGSLSSGLTSFDALDSDRLRWRSLSPVPTAGGGMAAVALDGRIHVLGGESPEGALARHEAYDPEQRRWLPLAPLGVARHGLGAGVVGGRLHAVGGGPAPGLTATSTLEILTRQSLP